MRMRREAVVSLTVLVFLGGVFYFLTFQKRSGRAYLDAGEVQIVQTLNESLEVWNQSGVRGRVLFLFDRRLNARPTLTSPENDNYVYLAMHRNIVRKVYHVLPSGVWPSVAETLSRNKRTAFSKGVFRFTIVGTPVEVLRVVDIPLVGEKVLVALNGDTWNQANMDTFVQLIRDGVIRPDIVTISGHIRERHLREIMTHVKAVH